jgi:hypothetical protein
MRYWAQENPRVNILARTQYSQNIHIIWTGIFNNNIIGAKGNLNSANYLDLLLTKVGTAL